MRAAAFALVAIAGPLAGCKGDAPPPKPHSGSGSGSSGSGSSTDPHAGLVLDAGAPLPVDAACEDAIKKASGEALGKRATTIIAGCAVCGDWMPILRWNTPAASGGPTRAQIEDAMLGCQGYCNGEAKLKFLGTLDNARGTASRMPWKQLAIACGDKVSAVPDGRYMDGPYFALDRIARAVGAKGGDVAAAAAGLEVPLPAIGVTGVGPPLPKVARGTTGKSADLHVTVLGTTISVGRTPRAKLTANGLAVDLGADGYPGQVVKVGELAAALKALAGTAKQPTVMIIAPAGTQAKDLVPVITAATMTMPTYLAVSSPDGDNVWDAPMILDVPLETKGKNALRIAAGMTVQELAETLAARPSP